MGLTGGNVGQTQERPPGPNEGGNAKAILISLDQGGVEIPAAAIDQKGSKLTVSVKMVGGSYEAQINKRGSELSGT
jgi:hypothetical protein